MHQLAPARCRDRLGPQQTEGNVFRVLHLCRQTSVQGTGCRSIVPDHFDTCLILESWFRSCPIQWIIQSNHSIIIHNLQKNQKTDSLSTFSTLFRSCVQISVPSAEAIGLVYHAWWDSGGRWPSIDERYQKPIYELVYWRYYIDVKKSLDWYWLVNHLLETSLTMVHPRISLLDVNMWRRCVLDVKLC